MATRQECFNETLTDIAYMAGGRKYYSGDSRADIQAFIAWAREFGSVYVNHAESNDSDYMIDIETFTLAKLDASGHVPITAPQTVALSPDHIARYRDVMVTIIEGGCEYWSDFSNVQISKHDKGGEWNYESFDMRDEYAKSNDAWHTVDVQTIAKGIALIVDGRVKVRSDILAACATLRADPVNADDDAEIADCIVQAALFEEIVYG